MSSIQDQVQIIQIDGGQLFYRTFGQSTSSPIIVLHGGPGLGQGYLLPQMAELGHFSFAIFYDQRGTGQSTSSDKWQSTLFQTYIRDLEQLRESFGFKRITLLGHSWGSILASVYALKYPNYVDKIIYLNPVPVSSAKYLEFVEYRNQLVNINKAELDKIRESELFLKGDPQTIQNYYRLYFTNYFANPEFLCKLSLTMTPEAAINNFKIYDLFYQEILNNRFDLYEELRKLSKPSLILAGDSDVIPLKYMKQLCEHIPASKLILLKECGHFPYIEQPNDLFQTVLNFMF